MSNQNIFLGIEGGGTRTIAIVADTALNVLQRHEFGPGNLRLLDSTGLSQLLGQIARTVPAPTAIGIGMAGLRTDSDSARVQSAAHSIWPGTPLATTNDLEIALRAADTPESDPRVLVLSGTGSCCFGRNVSHTEKVGGWGHLLGDLGSGYDIAIRALRAVVYDYDRFQRWGPLAQSFMRALVLNSPDDLISWIQHADKRSVARLAISVFQSAGDPIAKRVLRDTAEQLATDAILCARRLASKNARIHFVFAGSVLRNQPPFVRRISSFIRAQLPNARFSSLRTDGALGAAKMALALAPLKVESRGNETLTKLPPQPAPPKPATPNKIYLPHFNPLRSPTEQRNPKSTHLDQLPIADAIELMLQAESEVTPAIRKEKPYLEKAVALATAALRRGGRLFYVGAGTSGRLGVLDASECPPTFRLQPDKIQGIIAGGHTALWQAVEGAEDDAQAGAQAIRSRAVTSRDLVIGIAASGRTPFVWGALAQARYLRAKTILICFNPHLEIAPQHRPSLLIAPDLGPEVLTGSTRLKCGTATKLILNMISTLAMVRLGKVVSNLMVDLNPSNVKLRDRAVRIVRELTGCTAQEATTALARHGWIVKKAWQSLSRRQKKPRISRA